MGRPDDIDLLGGAERLLEKTHGALAASLAAVDLHLAGAVLDGGDLSETETASLRAVSEQLHGIALGALATLQEMHALAPDVVAVPVLPAGVDEQKALPPAPELSENSDVAPEDSDQTEASSDPDPIIASLPEDSLSDTVDVVQEEEKEDIISSDVTPDMMPTEAQEGIPAKTRKRQIDMLTSIFGEHRFDAFRTMSQEEMVVFGELIGDLFKEITVPPRGRANQQVRGDQFKDFIAGAPITDMERKYHRTGIAAALSLARNALLKEVNPKQFDLLFDDTRMRFKEAQEAGN